MDKLSLVDWLNKTLNPHQNPFPRWILTNTSYLDLIDFLLLRTPKYGFESQIWISQLKAFPPGVIYFLSTAQTFHINAP